MSPNVTSPKLRYWVMKLRALRDQLRADADAARGVSIMGPTRGRSPISERLEGEAQEWDDMAFYLEGRADSVEISENRHADIVRMGQRAVSLPLAPPPPDGLGVEVFEQVSGTATLKEAS